MKTFEECCEYLGIPTDLPKCYVREKQFQAAYKLSVCMMAWNKMDEFKPDEMASYYQKGNGYIPHFCFKKGRLLSSGFAYNGSHAGLVAVNANDSAAATNAYIGLRLGFKTTYRAVEVGEVFIEIFNELI